MGTMICSFFVAPHQRGYGAMAARLTPDQKVGRSNRSGLIFRLFCHVLDHRGCPVG